MMRDELLNPLAVIGDSCEGLMDDANGMLSVSQERVVSSIYEVTRKLYDLVISLPDVDSTSVQTLLSYETRSHLASIIGYIEVLLDEHEDPLTLKQVEYARTIQSNGKHVLVLVNQMLDNG
jgi:hypothetical protein